MFVVQVVYSIKIIIILEDVLQHVLQVIHSKLHKQHQINVYHHVHKLKDIHYKIHYKIHSLIHNLVLVVVLMNINIYKIHLVRMVVRDLMLIL